MSQINTVINCPEIQKWINNLFTIQDPTLITEPLVLTEYLLSPANRSGAEQSLKQQVAPGGGKKRIVQVKYSPRLSEAEVQENEGNTDCVANPAPGETTAEYEVGDDYVQVSAQIDPRELSLICDDNTEYAARKVAQIMNALERKIETMSYSQLALLNGKFSVGEPDVTGDVKTVTTRKADGTFSTDALTQVPTATRYAAYPGAPILFGGRQWGVYMREVNAGCCAIDGINVSDLAAQYGMGFVESYRADDAFGDGGAMTVAPGAVQMLEYLEYEGMANIDLGTVQQMVVVSPITGQRFDMKVNIDCNGVFNFFLRKTFKLVTMPNDVFYSDDRLSGVNFVNEFQIDNPTS